ncbi:MAG: hypothetical protein ACRDKZ_02420 [Actinomycetota bacterium]
MARIEVAPTQSQQTQPSFHVTVEDGGARSAHEVTVDESDLKRLARPGEDPSDFIRRCFEFLLEREPQSAIMASFDDGVNGTYVPEFEGEIRG